MPRKIRVEVLQPVKKNKKGIFKSENTTKVGTVNLDICFLFTDVQDPFPDCINLGVFRKRLLIEICFNIKAYFIKNEVVSKECSLFHFAGACK